MGFGIGVLRNGILELGFRVLRRRRRRGRGEKLQEMRFVLANMLGQLYGEGEIQEIFAMEVYTTMAANKTIQLASYSDSTWSKLDSKC